MNRQRANREIGTVERASDCEGLREFARATGKVFSPFAAGAHPFDSIDGLKSTDQHTARHSVGLGNDIETFVNTVVEIDVGVARLSENHFGASRDTRHTVCRQVSRAQIGLGFNDDPGGIPMNQQLSQQIARDIDGVPCVE